MNIDNGSGVILNDRLIENYFRNLVNHFYKILPLYEAGEETLTAYMVNLRDELIGCEHVLDSAEYSPMIMTLISVLQFLIDNVNDPLISQHSVKSKVFGSINICNRLAESVDISRRDD